MSEFDLKKRRRELHLTLEQVGDYIGVGKSTVRKWETGMIENMKTDKILLLSEILKIHPLSILGIDENINSNYFKFSFNNQHIYIPKKFIDDFDKLTVFINKEEYFCIPSNSFVVARKSEILPNNCLVAVKISEDDDEKIMKYSKMNDNLIILNDGEKDQIFDNIMGDYLEIIGEVIYHVIPDTFYEN